jgi:hypothetical protein
MYKVCCDLSHIEGRYRLVINDKLIEQKRYTLVKVETISLAQKFEKLPEYFQYGSLVPMSSQGLATPPLWGCECIYNREGEVSGQDVFTWCC